MYEYTAKVLKIIDGDTIDLQIDLGFDIKYNTRVRLYGINTPETRTRNKEEKEKGLAAKARVEELLESGECIIRTEYDKRGKFGRVLGIIYPIINETKAELSLQQRLVNEGHATSYFGGSRE